MKKAPIGKDEQERLDALLRLKVLDTTEESFFDDITKLASSICNAPIALISLVDKDRQWFKSHFGLNAHETPRDISFCGHAIHQKEIFEISDSKLDERFVDNPFVTGDLKIRFYAGAPLITKDGYAIGTLCVIDHEPKALTEEQKKSLETLSNHVISLLQLRLSNAENMQKTEQIQLLTECMSEGMVLQEQDGKIIQYNSSALDVLGLTADQLLGRTSLDPNWNCIKEDGSPFPGEEHPAMVSLRTGNKLKNIIMGVHLPNNYLRWISINSTPMFENGSKTAYQVLCTFNDITEEKELEHKLVYTSKMTALGEMAGGMAHEINNPLAIISAQVSVMLELIKKDTSESVIDKLKERLSQVEKTVVRIAKIIGGLRAFSRNAEQDKKSNILISQIFEDTLNLCQDRFISKSIELRLNPSKDIQIKARSSQITQVLLNLLNNSFDAINGTPNATIEINTEVSGNILKILVSDSGKKISPEIQVKMMQPFFTTKEVGKGTGLGLSISKGLVESHQGKFYYDPTFSKNTFVIELPINE